MTETPEDEKKQDATGDEEPHAAEPAAAGEKPTAKPDEGDVAKAEATPRPAKASARKKATKGEAAKPVKAEAPPARDDAGTRDADAEDDETTLIPRGNPLRWTRGGVTALVGALGALLLMGHNAQIHIVGVPLGFLFILVTTFGLMDLVGSFDDAGETHATAELGPVLRSLAAVFGTGVLFFLTLAGGQSGMGTQPLWGALVTLAFVGAVLAVYDLGVKLGPWRSDETGEPRPLWKRHGFWLVVIAALLYLPALGSYSLWDPWETHYGEVSREILARDDWISIWWAQDGWFFSKPIMNFWIQALAMATMGTHYQPDKMLIGVGGLPNAHPEWVVRTPNFLLTVIGLYIIYKGVAKVFGRRAGFLGGLVLATMPQWYFLAHQTMTDMPFVSTMTAAMGLLLLGLHTEENRKVRLYELNLGKTKLRLSGWHLVFGAILAVALPQILYLASRNLELVLHGSGPHGFRAHWDEFYSGSGLGNCGLPGNEACNLTHPASIPRAAGIHPTSFGGDLLRMFGGFEPVVQAVVWGAGIGILLYLSWGERRLRRLYYLAAWFFAALSTMAKGPAGFGLPMLCGFGYVMATRRWSELLRFEIVAGLLIILTVAIPWYVAMYVRHGTPFTDRLIFHDMFNRAFHHVHDTNEGDDTSFRFYIWQLGYATYPWTGLAPLGLLWWLRRRDNAASGRGDVSIFLAMWFIFAFALFSFMGTKFHHYIFPAVPPIAMLIGIVLDDMIGNVELRGIKWPLFAVGAGAAAVLVVLGVTAKMGGTPWGEGKGGITAVAVVAGVLLVVALARKAIPFLNDHSEAVPRAETPKTPELPAETTEATPYRGAPAAKDDGEQAAAERRAMHERLMLGAAAIAGTLIMAIVGRDLAIKPENSDQPGAIRLLQLFTYNYRRPWPEVLHFGAVLTGFAIVACVLGVALAVYKLRRHAVLAMCGFAFVWALWGLDVYMVKTAPHWGQHDIIQKYYEDRTGPEQPLVAYQMNWKGENFYTSNHIPAFVSTGSTFSRWVREQKAKGTTVMYFITEHTRTGGLRAEVGAKSYREVTDKALCNKFVLVRAEL